MKALVKVCKLLRLKAAPNEVSDQISWELNEKVAGCWSCLALGGLDKSKEEGRASALEAQGLSAVFESLGSRPCHAWLCICTPHTRTQQSHGWLHFQGYLCLAANLQAQKAAQCLGRPSFVHCQCLKSKILSCWNVGEKQATGPGKVLC